MYENGLNVDNLPQPVISAINANDNVAVIVLLHAFEAMTEVAEICVVDKEDALVVDRVRHHFCAELAAGLGECFVFTRVHSMRLCLIRIEVAVDFVAQFAWQAQEWGFPLASQLPVVCC